MNNLVNGLRILLATHFSLYQKTHLCHWNVVGHDFYEYHKLFENQYIELWEQVDTIAEKIRELDEFVSLTPGDQIKYSLIEVDVVPGTGVEYANILCSDHEKMIFLLNKVFVLAERENNQAVMNYLAERLDAHAKARWFLRSSKYQ